jgi:hypothetical protein
MNNSQNTQLVETEQCCYVLLLYPALLKHANLLKFFIDREAKSPLSLLSLPSSSMSNHPTRSVSSLRRRSNKMLASVPGK